MLREDPRTSSARGQRSVRRIDCIHCCYVDRIAGVTPALSADYQDYGRDGERPNETRFKRTAAV